MDAPQNGESPVAGGPGALEKEEIESLSTTDIRAGVDCQGSAPEVLLWLDRHAAHLLPGHRGFAWNTEPLTTWKWPTGKPFTLSGVAAAGAMFTTSCRFATMPTKAEVEAKDVLNLAPLRTGHLCMDFDSKEDRALALADVRRLVFEVLPPLGIAPEQVAVFLSGGKGFHCIVYADALGLEGGDRLLPRIYKALVKEIGAVLPTLDLSIYNMGMGRQFRLPQIRRANGLHKIPLRLEEIREGGLTIEEMVELARSPRLDVDMPPVVPSAPDAPIRAMTARIKAQVWSQETARPARQEFDNEDLDALAAELPPCQVKVRQTEDYSEIGPNFDTIISEVVVPYCAEARIASDDAEELYGDWAAGFVGSGTYYTADMRLAQLRQKLNRPARRFDCSIVRARVKGFSCNGCAVHAREAVKAFQDAPMPDLPPMPGPVTEDAGLSPWDRINLLDYRVGRYLKARPAPGDYAFGGLRIGTVGIIVGPPGTGKTHLAQHIGASVATGNATHMGGLFTVPRQGRVVILSAEDDEWGVHDRVWRQFGEVFDAFGMEDAQAVMDAERAMLEDNLIVFPTAGLDLHLTCKNHANIVLRDIVFDRLLKWLRGVSDLRLVVLDPLVKFYGGEENDNSHADFFVNTLVRLALKLNCAVLISHHTVKGYAKGSGSKFDLDMALSQEAARGASAFTGAVAWQYNLVPLPAVVAKQKVSIEAKVDGEYLAGRVSKNRYGTKSGASFFHVDAGGVLHVHPGLDGASEAAPIEDLILAEIQRQEKQGEQLWARTPFAAHYARQWKEHGASVLGLRGTLTAMVNRGELFEVTRKYGHRASAYLASKADG